MFARIWKDHPLRNAMVVAFFFRLVPMLLWIDKPCVRDECTYVDLAASILRGEGMVGTHGWLWAPAYPMLLALHQWLFVLPGSVQLGQLLVATWCVHMLYDLTEAEYGRRAGLWAAWAYALNPTFIFYTSSLWSETFYSGLLIAAMLSLRAARGSLRVGRAVIAGVMLGCCVLFRGVATYMLPVFIAVLTWGRVREAAAWKQAIACAVAAVLVVAPYSVYATTKFGGLVVSDRTLGQMMYLGNNDFPPMTFDYGNGQLATRAYQRAIDSGRKPCKQEGNPVEKDQCEADRGVAWITSHPESFVARIPLRVAQLVTPHSFLTRNLRWGRWRGIPDWGDELLIVGICGFSFATLIGGTIGWFTRAKGWYAAGSGLILFYHVAAIAALAGLSRYRIPLEPLWLVHAAAFFTGPRAAFKTLADGSVRSIVGVFTVCLLLVLMLRFLPSGWPWWREW
ncbi:MAG: hypothetical protein EXR69_03765 [Myxococcales bacterium]|nr:hypothetical protein [Myxococcales bacterium]